jgi:hypothetical protein
MAAHSRVIFTDNVNGNAIARHWIRKTGYMLNKGLEYRKRHPEKNQFTDIRYENLVSSSHDVLADIYKLNGGLTPELLKHFTRAENENPMRKYGIHEYRLEDFGAGKEDIIKETAGYREFFS